MPEAYSAADLDRWVTLKSPANPGSDPTNYGKAPPTHSVAAEVPALVEVLSGRDLVYAQQAQSMATHKVVIRWIAGISPDWVIDWEGRTMQIDGFPLEIGRRRFLKIMCVARG